MHAPFKAGIAASVLCALFAFACSATTQRSGFGQDTDPNLADGGRGHGGSFGGGEAGPAKECAINVTSKDLDKDYDGDGFPLRYDCNECNTAINKGAYDIPGNGIDEDCSGTADDEVSDDKNIDLDTGDAFEAARAIGLKKADDQSWGVIDAKWVQADGKSDLDNSLSYGVLPDFGDNAPQAGVAMLALSSGFARAPGQPGYADGHDQQKGYSSKAPKGFPKDAKGCGIPSFLDKSAHDSAALSVTIRVPTNAKSFSYQQFFFTHEYPDFVCNQYNDFFVAMMDPVPGSLPDGNIAFDQDTNPISVNNSFLQACKPGTHGSFGTKKFTCPLGTDPLQGTGFENAGATGWLTTTAPVTPGSEITLLFAVWDAGDEKYDSTVLIDDFKFFADGAGTTQTKPSDPK